MTRRRGAGAAESPSTGRVLLTMSAPAARPLADLVPLRCPGCGRALPVGRRTDPDFTVCVCCKIDTIDALPVAPVAARPPSDVEGSST